MQKKISIIVACIIVLSSLFCCNNDHRDKSAKTADYKTDSIQIRSLLSNIYKWHEAGNHDIGFSEIIKDSFQIGLDTSHLASLLGQIKKTGFFTEGFVQNYRQIVTRTDYKLRNDTIKRLNEINFGYQESDPWNFFQDSIGNYWDSLVLHDLQIFPDSASVKWGLKDLRADEGYKVKLVRENGNWRVAYMQGFDTSGGFW